MINERVEKAIDGLISEQLRLPSSPSSSPSPGNTRTPGPLTPDDDGQGPGDGGAGGRYSIWMGPTSSDVDPIGETFGSKKVAIDFADEMARDTGDFTAVLDLEDEEFIWNSNEGYINQD